MDLAAIIARRITELGWCPDTPLIPGGSVHVTANSKRKFEDRRRSEAVIGLTPLAHHGKPKCLGSGRSTVAKLKVQGIDGRSPPGVEPAASFDIINGREVITENTTS